MCDIFRHLQKYLNIPYAEPPTAKLRFQPPKSRTSCAKNINKVMNNNTKPVSGSKNAFFS